MTLVWMIYLVFTVLPAVKSLAFVVTGLWVVSIPLLALIGLPENDINKSNYCWGTLNKKILPKWPLIVVIFLVGKLVPTQEVTAYMIAGYGVEKLVQSEAVQEIGSDGLDIIKKMMEKAKEQIETKENKQ